MDKFELRKSITNKLKNIAVTEKKIIEQQQCNHLIASSLWKQANRIGITISQGFEWNTKSIIEAAWSQDKFVCVPKCFPLEKKLTFYQFESYDQLEIVYYNLLEPMQEKSKEIHKHLIDLLIVPGLVFDNQGYRIGFGGGYYDRFLTDFKGETISLTSAKQLVEELPTETYDIPVKHIITEYGFV